MKHYRNTSLRNDDSALLLAEVLRIPPEDTAIDCP